MSNKKMDKYTFWTDDPSILVRNNNYINFFPKRDMTRVQQLNSLSLLLIYTGIFLPLLNRNYASYLQLIIICILMIIVFYYVYHNDKKGKKHEIKKQQENMENVKLDDDGIVIESGYYDPDGNLVIGRFTSHEKNKNNELELSLKEMKKYRNAHCRKPTEDNPFMNPLASDYNKECPKACNVDDEDLPKLQHEIDQMFNKDLYKDTNDLFDVKNAQRQFYTIPEGGIPHDQPAFAEWLYKTPKTCKEDPSQCTNFEDLRYSSLRYIT